MDDWFNDDGPQAAGPAPDAQPIGYAGGGGGGGPPPAVPWWTSGGDPGAPDSSGMGPFAQYVLGQQAPAADLSTFLQGLDASYGSGDPGDPMSGGGAGPGALSPELGAPARDDWRLSSDASSSLGPAGYGPSAPMLLAPAPFAPDGLGLGDGLTPTPTEIPPFLGGALDQFTDVADAAGNPYATAAADRATATALAPTRTPFPTRTPYPTATTYPTRTPTAEPTAYPTMAPRPDATPTGTGAPAAGESLTQRIGDWLGGLFGAAPAAARTERITDADLGTAPGAAAPAVGAQVAPQASPQAPATTAQPRPGQADYTTPQGIAVAKAVDDATEAPLIRSVEQQQTPAFTAPVGSGQPAASGRTPAEQAALDKLQRDQAAIDAGRTPGAGSTFTPRGGTSQGAGQQQGGVPFSVVQAEGLQLPPQVAAQWNQLDPRTQQTIFSDALSQKRSAQITADQAARQQQAGGATRPAAAGGYAGAAQAGFSARGGAGGFQQQPYVPRPPSYAAPRAPAAAAPVVQAPPFNPNGADPSVLRWTPQVTSETTRDGLAVPADVALAAVHALSHGSTGTDGGLMHVPAAQNGGQNTQDVAASLKAGLSYLYALYQRLGSWTAAMRQYAQDAGMNADQVVNDFSAAWPNYQSYFGGSA